MNSSYTLVVALPWSDKYLFDVFWWAREGWSQGTKETQFQLVGGVLQNLVDGNQGVPPICYCQDQHGTQALINRAFVGRCSPEELAQAEFFKRGYNVPNGEMAGYLSPPLQVCFMVAVVRGDGGRTGNHN